MGQSLQTTYRWLERTDVVAYTGTPGLSRIIAANVSEIRVVCTTDAWINIGTAPTAAASDDGGFFMPAKVPEYFHVSPGQKVSVIQDTAGGNMSMSEFSR